MRERVTIPACQPGNHDGSRRPAGELVRRTTSRKLQIPMPVFEQSDGGEGSDAGVHEVARFEALDYH